MIDLSPDDAVGVAAAVLDDLEHVRIGMENRHRQLTRTEADADGKLRGFGLDASHPAVARLEQLLDALKRLEHEAGLNLARELRRHPLGPWMAAQRGIGPKQGARLLAAIGDPAWNPVTNQPRTLGQLRQYCGHGDPARSRRRKGEVASYNPSAKMRLYLVAEKCVQVGKAANTPYYQLYREVRAKYTDATHVAACPQCGPAGHPAVPGSPLSEGHKHARALRAVGKRILRDLRLEARRLRGMSDD